MRILQTIGETGAEREAIAAWSEPRVGQGLRPRFGSRRFPARLLYGLLLVMACVLFNSLNLGKAVSFQHHVLLPIILVAVAWPLLVALDRLNRRNIWIYADRISISHANHRITLPKVELKQIFLYQTRKSVLALEMVTVKGKAAVVALPNDVSMTEVLAVLRKAGYKVEEIA